MTPKDSSPTAAGATSDWPGPDPQRVSVDVAALRPPRPRTPAARLGSHYANVTEAALLELRETPNRARVFVLLASGWRKYRTCRRSGRTKGGPLAFGFRDLAAWTGHCGPTLNAHLASLVDGG